MGLEEAQDSGDVVAGTLLVASCPAVTLLDRGASYLFISSTFLEHIGVESEPLPWRMHIRTGNGLVEVSRICLCPLVVSGCQFLARLIEFPMKNFDVVLDMDWLSAPLNGNDRRRKRNLTPSHNWSRWNKLPHRPLAWYWRWKRWLNLMLVRNRWHKSLLHERNLH